MYKEWHLEMELGKKTFGIIFGWAFLQDAMLYSLGHHGLVHWMNDGWTNGRRLYLLRQMGELN